MEEQQAIIDVLQQNTSGPDRQKVEEVCDAQSLLNAPILSQITHNILLTCVSSLSFANVCFQYSFISTFIISI